jgi:hypothetical protein
MFITDEPFYYTDLTTGEMHRGYKLKSRWTMQDLRKQIKALMVICQRQREAEEPILERIRTMSLVGECEREIRERAYIAQWFRTDPLMGVTFSCINEMFLCRFLRKIEKTKIEKYLTQTPNYWFMSDGTTVLKRIGEE